MESRCTMHSVVHFVGRDMMHTTKSGENLTMTNLVIVLEVQPNTCHIWAIVTLQDF
jgi:hypothetical protein